MTEVTLVLDPIVINFYNQIAISVGASLESVLCDALFKLAGELSLEALQTTK